ncbi:EAL domain-containing protein [Photobacterium lutimaris]|uniref:EAL domain-containing protein n=1 Tax=Photobacterium lutimaris TaxID=388278 RepID=A0A2T3J051_9GAMM|nr:EAL domain-containing protein [Photobacterium lutimaris]PSU34332.1 EAL domain-containing protein [Photobacterium lutimaris]TDR75923.1 sensor c-di-GMP phosphodiesterase-like protein [Photobacterium lutimaris]
MNIKNQFFIFICMIFTGLVTFFAYINAYAISKSEDTAKTLLSSISTEITTIEKQLISIAKLYPDCSEESRNALEAMTLKKSVIKEVIFIRNNTTICSDRSMTLTKEEVADVEIEKIPAGKKYSIYQTHDNDNNTSIFFMMYIESGWYQIHFDRNFLQLWLKEIASRHEVYAYMYNNHRTYLSNIEFINIDKLIFYKNQEESKRYPVGISVGYTSVLLFNLIMHFLPTGILLTIVNAVGVTFLAHYFVLKRVPIDIEIQKGLNKSEFYAEYQPIVSTNSGQWIGAELLVRWQHPKKQKVMPAEFIPAAEQSGLINDITLQLLEQAAKDKASMMAMDRPFYLSINVTASMIASPHFVEAITAIITRNPRLQSGIVMEFSERENFSNTDVSLLQNGMQALRDQGIKWALDDFGTGYAGLSTLQALSFDIIKIDRAFVAASSTDSVTKSILGNIAQIGHNLSCHIIAEGVETLEQVEHVKALNIQSCQGFFYAKPMPFEHFLAKFKVHSALPEEVSSSVQEIVGVQA